MFCPNCGAKNNRNQNYCRFCGLNLQETAKSLNDQMAFGESSQYLKNLSKARQTANFVLTVLIGSSIASGIFYLFYDAKIGASLLKISMALFFLSLITQGIFTRLQRKESEKKVNRRSRTNEFESKKTAKLLEEKPFVPARSVVENSTQLFPVENKTRKLD